MIYCLSLKNKSQQKQIKMNTQIKKSANGKVYQISTSFKVGDSVAVHNSITGEISYTGIIKNYRFNKKAKNYNHFAQIVIAGLNGYKENLLGTALVIN